jgi:hypothetical protein
MPARLHRMSGAPPRGAELHKLKGRRRGSEPRRLTDMGG